MWATGPPKEVKPRRKKIRKMPQGLCVFGIDWALKWQGRFNQKEYKGVIINNPKKMSQLSLGNLALLICN